MHVQSLQQTSSTLYRAQPAPRLRLSRITTAMSACAACTACGWHLRQWHCLHTPALRASSKSTLSSVSCFVSSLAILWLWMGVVGFIWVALGAIGSSITLASIEPRFRWLRISSLPSTMLKFRFDHERIALAIVCSWRSAGAFLL